MKSFKRVALASCLVLALAATGMGVGYAGEEFVVRGADWTQSSETGKRGFLAGVATMIEVEMEFQSKGSGCSSSSIPRFHDGLSDETLLTVKGRIDDYFVQNPDKLDKPVIHVIWDIANGQ